ncbi:O-antigen ligase family protein [uncultured Flavobacterium sp.]|uniref:O-antigen ligase family protein n=1 Tax=uncultured Flavobacterium sp. TaxID=165435 RepID=UPI0030ECBF4B
MINSKTTYSKIVLFHAIIGGAIFVLPFLAKVYAICIILFGINYVVKNRNQNNEALLASAYVVGAEVFLRMTQGNFFEQYAKYGVILFLLIGMFYTSFSKKSFIYWLFLLLLVPGVILSFFTLNFETDIRKAITFNIIGSVTLFLCALYCYDRKVSLSTMLKIVNMLSYPIIGMLVYMFLYTPSIKDVVTNTESNFQTSGGYGPNQVSTILGLGIFLFFTILLLDASSRTKKIIVSIILLITTFRGIVTFSRGGIITGILMICILVFLVLLNLKSTNFHKIYKLVALVVLTFIGIWTYSSFQTSGLIDKRYANEDARGREKESKLTGRETLIESEFEMFFDNPFFGVGVGKNKEYREETTGIEAASHNEISRLFAEHGLFGILALIILLITPVLLYLNNKQNIFVFSFMIFWLLTINHAAMRIAAPAFIYALSLLKVSFDEEPTIHREQIT